MNILVKKLKHRVNKYYVRNKKYTESDFINGIIEIIQMVFIGDVIMKKLRDHIQMQNVTTIVNGMFMNVCTELFYYHKFFYYVPKNKTFINTETLRIKRNNKC